MYNMFNSKLYWEARYKNGGNSGAGSYNKLALFKAEIINEFIKKNNIKSVIDYGVGDGNQLKLLYTNIDYIGLDISPTVINKCKHLFINDIQKKFYVVDENLCSTIKADLVLSCDVLYHLIEESVYRYYIHYLFTMSNKYVIIYAKDNDINHCQHVKFRKFTEYIKENYDMWKLIQHIPNRYPQIIMGKDNENTSPSDFYIYEKI